MSIMESVKGFFKGVLFTTKKYAPQICFVAGTACLVCGTVAVVKSTLDNKETFDKDMDEINTIKEYAKEHISDEPGSEYTSNDYKTDIWTARGTFVKDVAKAYWFPTVAYIMSVVLYAKGYATLFERVAQATATAMIFKHEAESYRKYIEEHNGSDADTAARFELEDKTGEDGKTKKEPPQAYPLEGTRRFFDATSEHWDKNPDVNAQTIKLILQKANRQLKLQGYLFLNDVLTMLDLPTCKSGQYLGWIYDKNVESKISFGPYSCMTPDMYEYTYNQILEVWEYKFNGDNVIPLEFNVDGNILDVAKFAA